MTFSFGTGLPLWVQYTQVGALVIVAIAGAVIAYRQWRTAHEKLRLDLFEKRWDVYELVGAFQRVVQVDYKPSTTDFQFIGKARSRARFLFGRDVNCCLATIEKLAAEIGAATKMMDTPSQGTSRDGSIESQPKLISDFGNEYDRLNNLMVRYMRFDTAL